MKRIIFLLCFALFAYGAAAQTTYGKVYDGTTNFKLNLTELPDGNILTGLGRTRAISHLDMYGNIVFTHSYWAHPHGAMSGLGGIRSIGGGRYGVVGGYNMPADTCSSANPTQNIFRPSILVINSTGSVLDHRYYLVSQGCRNTIGDFTVTADGGILAWGYEKSFLAMKVDSALEPLWAKRFPNRGGFQFIKELPGGDLLAGINMDTAGVVVARMDANGNFLWCKSYIRPQGVVHDAVIESDDSFVITGFTDSLDYNNYFIPYPPTYHPKLFMLKLDGQGNVEWCKGYDSAPALWYSRSPSHILKSQDGQYTVMATMGLPNNLLWDRPLLMKTDTNGDTLWTRAIGAPGYNYNAFDLIEHSGGGYLLSGLLVGDVPLFDHLGGPFIYKTDPLGRSSCHDSQHPLEISDLFPTDSTVSLTSTDGLTVHPAFMSDTTFAPITEFDLCLINSLERTARREPSKPTIYPNPSPGRFTVEFTDPLMADSYYSLFDTMGKLLLQRPLPTGATLQEVDLSRFGAGSYVIKFTSPDGVCYERVVVE
jgi:hypothetical protein